MGVPLHVVQDRPKMALYAEPLPGVPWPPGFKAEMDAWMLQFFGLDNPIKDGEMLNLSGHVHMNPRTFHHFKTYLQRLK